MAIVSYALELFETYIVRLSMQRKDKLALVAAKCLLERFPDQPRWSRLVGIVMQYADPKGSIEYLQREFAATGSADTLTRIARGQTSCGHPVHAKAAIVVESTPSETNRAWRKMDSCASSLADQTAIRTTVGLCHGMQRGRVGAIVRIR